MFVHGHHGRRNTVAAGAVDALDLPAALSAPTASSIPVPTGVRPDVHERFWSVVARACEKECARFPALIFKPDAADDTEAN